MYSTTFLLHSSHATVHQSVLGQIQRDSFHADSGLVPPLLLDSPAGDAAGSPQTVPQIDLGFPYSALPVSDTSGGDSWFILEFTLRVMVPSPQFMRKFEAFHRVY
ncbi:hypothetical protein J6590_004113 [Homalodisca vitripennis]|nr:hypothetical protein J6590_004113 [Homalodisca vitripennis]